MVREVAVPTVIDADGLNALAGQTDVLADKGAPIILTPHPGELARLCESTVAEVQAHRLPVARELAQEWGVAVSYTHLDVYKRQGDRPAGAAALCPLHPSSLECSWGGP